MMKRKKPPSPLRTRWHSAQWPPHEVPEKEKEAKVLRHVFDDLQDHFLATNAGRSKSEVQQQQKKPCSPSRGNGNNLWCGDLDFTYNIKATTVLTLPYVGIGRRLC